MNLADHQRRFLEVVASACRVRATDGTFVLVTEWLGYLPYGAYVWVEVGGARVDEAQLLPWDTSDVTALVRAGLVEESGREVLSADGYDTRTRCRLTPAALALVR